MAHIRRVQDEALELFKKKNADYGDAYKTYGPVGVIVRIGDKISRLASVDSKSVRLVASESLRDTLVDLHNYAAMAVALLDEEPDRPSPVHERVQELRVSARADAEAKDEGLPRIGAKKEGGLRVVAL